MKVIFDTDPGIDDAMALLYLNAAPSAEIIGITTVIGNASLPQCTTNALYLCERFEIETPVYKGESLTLNDKASDWFPDFVHGKNGLADLPVVPQTKEVEALDAVSYLIQAVEQFPGEVRILAVGRLTNVARAIQRSETFTQNVKDIIFMGGTFEHPGNVTPYSEANAIGDPEAVALTFESGVPLTMVGLDVTMQTCMTQQYVQDLAQDMGDLGQYLIDINQVYARHYLETDGLDAFPVHDSSAVAYTLDESLFKTERGTLSCVTEGEERGRTAFVPYDTGPHRVCIGVDSDRLLNHYRQIVQDRYLSTQQGS